MKVIKKRSSEGVRRDATQAAVAQATARERERGREREILWRLLATFGRLTGGLGVCARVSSLDSHVAFPLTRAMFAQSASDAGPLLPSSSFFYSLPLVFLAFLCLTVSLLPHSLLVSRLLPSFPFFLCHTQHSSSVLPFTGKRATTLP